MTRYNLLVDLRGPFSDTVLVRHLGRTVERDWPSVPRVGDLVSLDDATGWAVPVGAVAFEADHVNLHFFELSERDLHSLTMAGFEPA